jgi:hypothetical protein
MAISICHADFLAYLLDLVKQYVSNVDSRQLRYCILSSSKLSIEDNQLLSLLLKRGLLNLFTLPNFQTQELSDTALAMAKLGHQDAAILNALLKS